jgi:NAD(P)H-dependent flavin oxidoreductase YrpB (nitropropane dioxygenase family)
LRQRDYYNYIIEAKPKRVVFNPGTENPQFYQLLQSNGIAVEVACTLVLLATNQY